MTTGSAPSPADLLSRCGFPLPGTAVTCAVSGGADSLALLVLAVESGCEVTAVHVDHGLRRESSVEADLVAGAADRFGASFRSMRVDVDDGPNLEARARAARYGVLPPEVLTGHTADDQAETVLLNLLRGAATDGLAGMRADRRPLLQLRRRETEELCARLDLEPFEDPMNDDPRFTRVRVRNEVLPLLESVARRDLVPLLCRQAGHLREVADLIDASSRDLDPTDARAITQAPRPLASAALRRWLASETSAGHPVDSGSIERVMRVASGDVVATEIVGGHRVARTHQRLRVENADRTVEG